MARGETTVVKTIHQRVRLNNSVNGNPRYRLDFSDGTSATTQSDSYCNYDVENLAERGATLELTLTRAGRVCGVRKVEPLQPMDHGHALGYLESEVQLFLRGLSTRSELEKGLHRMQAAVALHMSRA